MRAAVHTLYDAADLSASVNSSAVDCGVIRDCSIQAIITGSSPTGTFKLQVSNDTGQVANWMDLAGSSQAITTTGNIGWSISPMLYDWVRIVYTRTSGTGNVSALLRHKAGA